MDSRLIYATSEALKNKVAWVIDYPDSEWSYFGIDDEIDKKSLSETVSNHFITDVLYVAISRKESFQILKENIEEAIGDLLGTKNFFIWDEDFKRVIEFNKIGTLRFGNLK